MFSYVNRYFSFFSIFFITLVFIELLPNGYNVSRLNKDWKNQKIVIDFWKVMWLSMFLKPWTMFCSCFVVWILSHMQTYVNYYFLNFLYLFFFPLFFPYRQQRQQRNNKMYLIVEIGLNKELWNSTKPLIYKGLLSIQCDSMWFYHIQLIGYLYTK